MATVAARHRALGLSDEELAEITRVLDRPPNDLELALFGVMWSEHCSYKSSRIHLSRLPTDGDRVLVGPGENAGVIDAGGGVAVAVRIESHNHPSAIEPHQGAATGVGGILRDIFTMGARPLCVLDPLFFGRLDTPRQRWLFDGVVGGISSYGNSVGVPTVGGELTFDPCYEGNPLVNVLCLGALPTERLVLGRASGVGNLAVLLGASTGRDGIGGVSVLASAGLGANGRDDDKRPSVQVGDPYEEKRLIEACLELLDRSLVVGIQDLGGAGLACATSETAARAGLGMDVDVAAVPRREEGMVPAEVMTSESQERMLAIVTPESVDDVAEVCRRWEVAATVVGRVTAPSGANGHVPLGLLRVRDGLEGPVLAEVPAAALADDAPRYDRARRRPTDLDACRADDPTGDEHRGSCREDLLGLVVDPSWVYRQYDHQLFLNTVVGPGGDAALLRLCGPGLPSTDRGVAITTDSNPRACALDPRGGTALVLAESIANLACVGVAPTAVVNCLNFGNPEHASVMWQLAECVDGLAEACRAFGLPVVGGNVSLYNEHAGRDIDPTPVLGVLGVVEELTGRPPGLQMTNGDTILLLGERMGRNGAPHPLGGSAWATRRGRRGGVPPALDARAHGRACSLVVDLVAPSLRDDDVVVTAVHDVSSGGLGVAMAELCLASGTGLRASGIDGHRELFCELPSRFLVASRDPDAVAFAAHAAGVPIGVLGVASGERLDVEGLLDVSLAELREAAALAPRGASNRSVA
ncbi:MAG TPA: phosphoribosylformylglycinamidine synthase subunit PurL [Acidimicrobiales bacterium]|jgi:phosphoribosylformylglycinamidine synthase|nr:phosphoribosylformylglycinamidine synthase subunit PurL [Acidimicrobiales bacterium]